MSDEEGALLSGYAAIYGKAERSLFAHLRTGGKLTDLKREFLRGFGITARQFNSISMTLNGARSIRSGSGARD